MPKLAFTTDRQLRSAKPRLSDYRIGCGCQLYLRITPAGFKYWQVRFYQPNGKEGLHQFASYPQVSLVAAKAQALVLLPELLAGRTSPTVIARQTVKAALSFDDCAAQFIQAKRPEWKNAKHAQQWANTLSQHASPVFGSKAIGVISRADVLRCLEPIWLTHNETASRLRGRIESVVDWAKAKGLFQGDNPAAWKGGLQNLLAAPSKAQKKTHHPSLPYALLPAFFKHLQTMPGVGSQALQFLILTACRTSEVLSAAWAEMSHLPTQNKNQISTTSSTQAAEQSKKTVWTIPQERMKARIEHRVPLAGAPLDILAGCWRVRPIVFSIKAAGDKPMSNMALAMLLRRAVAAAPTLAPMPITVHGFRSTFRNWAAEQTSYPREVCEQALAHQLPDKVESAYLRSDFLDKRRDLMKDWARFCLNR